MENQKELRVLYHDHFKNEVSEVRALKAHASTRKIFRLIGKDSSGKDVTAIGVENNDIAENNSFIYLSKYFREKSLPVPEIYNIDSSGKFYLQEDLGDTTLYDVLFSLRKDSDPFPREVEKLYNAAVSALPHFQIRAASGIDYSKTSSFKEFSEKHMLADMEYFRVQYLDQVGFNYSEPALTEDFKAFAKFLSGEEAKYFMYRDFQSRNIMVKGDRLYFIDYQAGCKGPLQYDLASLLFQAQARIPCDARERLLGVYLNSLASFISLDRHKFLSYFYAYVVMRIMQVLGTYGLRGLKERKQYFIDSIELALANLRYVYRTQGLPIKMPEFERFIGSLDNLKEEKLTLSIYSFSFKLAIDTPFNQHGGGFVFDCRCLPNPGRLEEYKPKSGLDREVIEYLESQKDVKDYFQSITAVIDQAIDAYLRRKFLSLSVAFGCTGGQHRSVFLAEKLAEHVKKKYDINVLTQHLTKDQWVRAHK